MVERGEEEEENVPTNKIIRSLEILAIKIYCIIGQNRFANFAIYNSHPIQTYPYPKYEHTIGWVWMGKCTYTSLASGMPLVAPCSPFRFKTFREGYTTELHPNRQTIENNRVTHKTDRLLRITELHPNGLLKIMELNTDYCVKCFIK